MNLESVRQKTRQPFLLAAIFFILNALFFIIGDVVNYLAYMQYGDILIPLAITCFFGVVNIGMYVVFSLWLARGKPNPVIINIAATLIGIRFVYDTISFFRGILSASPAAGAPLYIHIINYASGVLSLISTLLLLLLLLKKRTGIAFIVCEALIAAFGVMSFLQTLIPSFSYMSALQITVPFLFSLSALLSMAGRIALAYGCMNLFFKKKESAAEGFGSSADEIETDVSI